MEKKPVWYMSKSPSSPSSLSEEVPGSWKFHLLKFPRLHHCKNSHQENLCHEFAKRMQCWRGASYGTKNTGWFVLTVKDDDKHTPVCVIHLIIMRPCLVISLQGGQKTTTLHHYLVSLNFQFTENFLVYVDHIHLSLLSLTPPGSTPLPTSPSFTESKFCCSYPQRCVAKHPL